MNANIQLLGENSPSKQRGAAALRPTAPAITDQGGMGAKAVLFPLQVPHLPLQAVFSSVLPSQSHPASVVSRSHHTAPLRFFSTVGHEFSICIHVPTIVSYPVARPHCRFMLCLHFFVFQLFLLPGFFLSSHQWSHTTLPELGCIVSLCELLCASKIGTCVPYLDNKTTPLESWCLGIDQANLGRKYTAKTCTLMSHCAHYW